MSQVASSSDLRDLERRRRRSPASRSHTWASGHWAPSLRMFYELFQQNLFPTQLFLLILNLKLFSSCQSLTLLCCAALYVMDWLSRVCLVSQAANQVAALRRSDQSEDRILLCGAEVAGASAHRQIGETPGAAPTLHPPTQS